MKLQLFVTLCWGILYSSYTAFADETYDEMELSTPQKVPSKNFNSGSVQNVDNDSDSRDNENSDEKDEALKINKEPDESEDDEDNENEVVDENEKVEEKKIVQPKETTPNQKLFAPAPTPMNMNGMTTTVTSKSQPMDKVLPTTKTSEVIAPLDNTDEESNEDKNNLNNFIGTSVDATTALVKQISTINITMDAWRNQTWANKSPREVVDMIETEIGNMYRDRYVHFIFISMGISSILFTLYVVQQVLENPNGMISKLCRCLVACIRILLCPIYAILCCPCCSTNKKNRPNTSKYTNLPVHDDEEDPKKH